VSATSGPIVGLLLAAGQGRRFGSDKLLHPLADGQPLVTASARHLAASTDHAIALVRPGQPALCTVLAGSGLAVVEVANAAAGMGVTLAAGVRAAAQAAGWVVALGDMPQVQPETLRQIRDALRAGAAIAAPYYHGRRGHPVGFDRRWYRALSALNGDTGARQLLQVHSAAITPIVVNDPGCLWDVDTPQDLLAPPSGQ